MSEALAEQRIPWLPEGRTIVVPGRGELFYRIHRHGDPNAPMVLLLHGWTVSADLQFFTAYQALAARCSFVALDHRGHGRGLRPERRFELEDAADDAAALVEALGVGPVVTVGYSMGGPVSLMLAHRHPDLVRGLVVEATALEWSATRVERFRWLAVHMLGPLVRSVVYRRWLQRGLHRLLGPGHQLQQYVVWLAGELRRSDAAAMVQAGQALSRYDARSWAGELGKPAAALITGNDHLVRPRKQRALAEALHAEIRELDADHAAPWRRPDDFARLTVELVELVAGAQAAAAA
jgi:pimeloyl-ACP methyl ester carboxylesterase